MKRSQIRNVIVHRVPIVDMPAYQAKMTQYRVGVVEHVLAETDFTSKEKVRIVKALQKRISQGVST